MQIVGLTNSSPEVHLSTSADIGYSALVYHLSNSGTTFSVSGADSINGGSSVNTQLTAFAALVVKSSTNTWSLSILDAATPSIPYTDVRTITASTTLDDSYWDDAGPTEDSRLPVGDTVVLADSASALTATLGGGSIFAHRIFDIVQVGAGTVSIAPASGFTINGATSTIAISAQWKKARVYYTTPSDTAGDFIVVLD